MLPQNVKQLVQQIPHLEYLFHRRRGTSGEGAPHDVITNDEIRQKCLMSGMTSIRKLPIKILVTSGIKNCLSTILRALNFLKNYLLS